VRRGRRAGGADEKGGSVVGEVELGGFAGGLVEVAVGLPVGLRFAMVFDRFQGRGIIEMRFVQLNWVVEKREEATPYLDGRVQSLRRLAYFCMRKLVYSAYLPH
jgi:hypothetical protein